MATSKSSTTKKPATKPAGKTTAATGKTTAKSVSSRTALAKKPATPLAKTAAPAAKKPATHAATPAGKPAAPTPEQRYRMVQEAAYYIAEKNGFAGGSMDYWIAAEAQIEALLSGKAKK